MAAASTAASPSMQHLGVAAGMCTLSELREQVEDLLKRELFESAVLMVRTATRP